MFKKFKYKKIIIFPAVNCVSEKVLVFEFLECGLYHEQKRHICMSEGGSNVLKTWRYNSALSADFSFL